MYGDGSQVDRRDSGRGAEDAVGGIVLHGFLHQVRLAAARYSCDELARNVALLAEWHFQLLFQAFIQNWFCHGMSPWPLSLARARCSRMWRSRVLKLLLTTIRLS